MTHIHFFCVCYKIELFLGRHLSILRRRYFPFNNSHLIGMYSKFNVCESPISPRLRGYSVRKPILTISASHGFDIINSISIDITNLENRIRIFRSIFGTIARERQVEKSRQQKSAMRDKMAYARQFRGNPQMVMT